MDEFYEPIWIEGETLPLLDLDGNPTGETINTGRWATENARRVRFILQSAKAALAKNDTCRVTGEGVPLIAIYKQGMEGKGRPSDIMLRRMDIYENGVVSAGNPYAFKNFQCDEVITDLNGKTGCLVGALNMSSTTALEITPKALVVEDSDGKHVYDKLERWQWRPDNFGDQSWETPMIDARAHRGQIRGDYVVLGFTWTPNWAASRNGNSRYDFFVRHSFDGGKTWKATGEIWPDDVTSVFDVTEPRNVSMLPNNKQSVVEPRIVGSPGTIWKKSPKTVPGTCRMEGGEYYNEAEDKQNKTGYVVSYGLEVNWKKGVDYDTDSNRPDPKPTDMNFSRTRNWGGSYELVWNDNAREHRWPWLANRSDVAEAEAQLKISPSGEKVYASYLSESGKSIPADDHFYGSDIWLRKVDWSSKDAVEIPPEPVPVPPPEPVPLPQPDCDEDWSLSCLIFFPSLLPFGG